MKNNGVYVCIERLWKVMESLYTERKVKENIIGMKLFCTVVVD